jgi:hypothetical protein
MNAMSGSLVASDVRGQFTGPDADVRALNPIVVFATDGDKRVQTKALKACGLKSSQALACTHALLTSL